VDRGNLILITHRDTQDNRRVIPYRLPIAGIGTAPSWEYISGPAENVSNDNLPAFPAGSIVRTGGSTIP
jgi:hypothetical protein